MPEIAYSPCATLAEYVSSSSETSMGVPSGIPETAPLSELLADTALAPGPAPNIEEISASVTATQARRRPAEISFRAGVIDELREFRTISPSESPCWIGVQGQLVWVLRGQQAVRVGGTAKLD